jgi:hypothetical protein
VSGAQPNSWGIEFPTVTKQIRVYNNGATTEDIRVAFSENGLKNGTKNYFVIQPGIDGGVGETFDVKATELYIMADAAKTPEVSVFASLTGIAVERINNISPSGSNWSGSSGIG